MRKKVTLAERLTGLFVLSAIVVIIAVFLLSAYKREWFQKQLYLVTYADEGHAITAGTKVFFKGTPAGTVIERPRIEKDPQNGEAKVRILMGIFAENAKNIPVDTQAHIQAPFAGFGEAKIMLTGGDPSHSYELSKEPYRIESALTSGMAAEIAASITELKIVKEITTTLERTNAVLAEIEARRESLVSSIDETLGNAAVIAGKIADGKGTAGRLVTDEELARDIAGIVSDVRTMISEMKKDIPEIAASLNDILQKFRGEEVDRILKLAPTLMEDIDALAKNVNSTLTEMQPMLYRARRLMDEMIHVLDDSETILADAKVIVADVKYATGELPHLLDAVDFTLKETTRVVTAVKENWLIKGFLPHVQEPDARLMSVDRKDPYAR
ncbi:MAG: Mce/MlaD family protein [Planctomycetota bacterium]|jgi:phospholipid/cholesterol/gamma-HCH transport system substrate-binding protein